jgi:hypothetical protein
MPKDASVDNTTKWDFDMELHVRDHTFGEFTLTVSADSRSDRLLSQLRREFPTLIFGTKDHWYWKLIHYFLLIVSFGGQKEFLSGYTTTIGMLIAFSGKVHKMIKEGKPGGPWEDRLWALLQHEREHLLDFKRFGVFLMFVLYVFAFFPVGLAWGRAWIERKGFIASLRAKYVCDRHWAEHSSYRDWWISRFTGSSYIWQWPFKKQVARWFDTELTALRETDGKRQG